MIGSLYTSVSGLKGHLAALNVTGNNISNINSVGFKGGRVTFRETIVQTLRGASRPQNGMGGVSPLQIGLGMGIASIDNIPSQGVLQNTGISTDLGINGEGFFILSDGVREYYSRVGAFAYDAEGNVINPSNGLILQGRIADENGDIPPGAAIQNIVLPFGRKVAARATSKVQFACNLDASATSATASLTSAGTTGITSVYGKAANGAGGTHVITITGDNATTSSLAGSNLIKPGALDGSETLGSLGVTDFSDFTVSVDGEDPISIIGLNANSTITDLINLINSTVSGVTASLSGGEVVLTRDYAGDGTVYNITTSVAADGNITRQIFGSAVGSAFVVDNGTASTLVATDVFTPTGKSSMGAVSLTLVTDERTGLVTGINGVGGGGIVITANRGLAAGTATIETAPTEHYSSIVVYDSLGVEHNLAVKFTRSPVANMWYWGASLDGSEQIKGGGLGYVTFNEDGSLSSFVYEGGSLALDFSPQNGADEVRIEFDPGTPGSFDGITQFASPFSTTAKYQDGYTMGTLTSIAIDSSGIITGAFSNGVTKQIAQIVLAKFNNPAGLERIGDGLFITSSNSGIAMKGEAGKVVSASISSGALEMSNVDLAEEFVKMVVAQRGFQANARILSASDDMLTELVNLTR
ncbi:MAG: flagellar hook-basal body complex protein [bacterium]